MEPKPSDLLATLLPVNKGYINHKILGSYCQSLSHNIMSEYLWCEMITFYHFTAQLMLVSLHAIVIESLSGNDDDDDQFRKRKKARTAFSREQVAELEKKFQEKKYLSSAERGELAGRLKLSDMQVKTWFQNRRMKYKRQSEEAEMEMKSPKYPYGSFVPYGGMTPFYGYVPMPYKSDNGMSYGYPQAIRSPQTTTTAMDTNFQPIPVSSPAMISSLSSPLCIPQRHNTPQIPRTNPTASYFSSNGVLTPLSPPTAYHQSYFSSDATSLSAPAQFHFTDWQRVIPTPPTP